MEARHVYIPFGYYYTDRQLWACGGLCTWQTHSMEHTNNGISPHFYELSSHFHAQTRERERESIVEFVDDRFILAMEHISFRCSNASHSRRYVSLRIIHYCIQLTCILILWISRITASINGTKTQFFFPKYAILGRYHDYQAQILHNNSKSRALISWVNYIGKYNIRLFRSMSINGVGKITALHLFRNSTYSIWCTSNYWK